MPSLVGKRVKVISSSNLGIPSRFQNKYFTVWMDTPETGTLIREYSEARPWSLYSNLRGRAWKVVCDKCYEKETRDD